jgi:SWI/SNF-related matrix-associated actin-dependent regulator of chromatin subfamily D
MSSTPRGRPRRTALRVPAASRLARSDERSPARQTYPDLPDLPTDPHLARDLYLLDPGQAGQSGAQQGQPHAINANAQHIQQQREIQQQHQFAVLRAKIPTDLNMPEGLEDINPYIGEYVRQYKALQEAERKIDMIMARKRLDMQDRYNRPERREGNLRIFIHNTYENQPWQQYPEDQPQPETFTWESQKDPEYTLIIRGTLQPEEDDMSDDEAEEMNNKVVEEEDEVQKDKKRFSNFFNRITIDVENPNNPNADPTILAEWKKGPNTPSMDYLKITRKGDSKFSGTISLYREEHPERYRLSHALTSTIDLEEGSRAEVLYCIFEYIKLFGLQDDDEKRTIRCDSNLKAVFGSDVVYFPQVPEMIIQHLHPLPPYQLRYTVHLDKGNTGQRTVYDVRVQVEDPICARIYAMTHSKVNAERNRKIDDCNKQLAIMIQQLHRHMARHAFFKAFSLDPLGFCRKWLASQQRDLRIILGERAGIPNGIEFEKGGPNSVWGSDAVRAAVQDMLAKDDAREAAKK